MCAIISLLYPCVYFHLVEGYVLPYNSSKDFLLGYPPKNPNLFQ